MPHAAQRKIERFTPITHVYLGLDLGQRSDYTALSAIEYRRYTRGEHHPATWEIITRDSLRIKDLERQPLGTTYPQIATNLRRVLEKDFYKGRTTLTVDAGGPGLAFFDFLVTKPVGANVMKVMITGNGATHYTNDLYYVSRSTLLTNLAILFQNHAISLDRELKESANLLDEQRNLKVAGNQGAHDDLAMATALAAWPAAKRLDTSQKVSRIPN